MAKKTNCKESLLDAAEAVVLEVGAGHMSLDVVAHKAGVSKGGLMYHFPTKEALVKAMIARLISGFYEQREEKKKTIKDSSSALFKAGVMASFERNERKSRMGLSILTAAANNPELLEPLKEAYQEHLREIARSGLPFEKTAVLSLATDGLMFLELLGLSAYTPAQRSRIQAEILRQVDQGAGGA